MIDVSKLSPVHGHILVQDDRKEEVSKGGIYIPESVQDESLIRGTILSIAEQEEDSKLDVKEADKIVYRQIAGAGQSFKVDGDTYRLLKPVEILAKVTE